MVKGRFLEFNEKSGIGDLLFVNMNHPTQYRFYRRRNSWDECFMVEFYSNSEDYQLYCGHNEQDRGMIDPITLLVPPYPKVEWKRIKFEPYWQAICLKLLKKLKELYSQEHDVDKK